ncbi:MAG: iron-containing alcohol dehydrogenase [Desulfurococcales archaeon]|nr:iron-containing alcohol dehydrogenase [Desulfurococcales archaeon]
MPEAVLPRRIIFDENVGDSLTSLLSVIGSSKALVITDKTLRELGLVDKILSTLENSEVPFKLFDKVPPEPPISIAGEIADAAREFNPDTFIAVGGGSVIDAAKAGLVKYVRPDYDVRDISPFEVIGLEARKPVLITIPTTSGTGSDATLGVVLTDNVEGDRIKIALGSPEVVPFATILDPDMVKALPSKLRIATGIDALSHAMEAYISNQANPLSDALAEKAVTLIFQYLSNAVSGDEEAISKMHIAATLAGAAFSNSGLGMAHAIAHPLGSILGTHHGLTVGVVLPYVMEYNIKHSEEVASKYKKLARIIGEHTDREIKDIVSAVIEFYETLRFPLKFRDVGISKEKYSEAIEKLPFLALQDADIAFAPVVPSPEEIKSLVENMY